MTNDHKSGDRRTSGARARQRALLRVAGVLFAGFALFLLAALVLLPGASDSVRLIAACVLSVGAGVATGLIAHRLGAR